MDPKGLEKRLEEFGIIEKNQDHTNHKIVKINENT